MEPLKTCPICLTSFHHARLHCPVCGAYHVIGTTYYDGQIEIVVAHGAIRANEGQRFRMPRVELCDAKG